jgi:3-methyladenine DNA glycosylase AlkD
MPAAADRELIQRIDRALRDAAQPERAPAMRAYMKSAMPYLGVGSPAVRRLTRAAATASGADGPVLLATAQELWDVARFREQWYAALELTGTRAALAAHDMSWLPFYDRIATTGAWWDVVDASAHRIGLLLRVDREPMTDVLRAWSRDDVLWRRRLSIIGQLDAKADTDLALLGDAILANAADREFFIRKAIGWALRQYARTDPDWVRAFLAGHAGVLSPLSVREAAKRL